MGAFGIFVVIMVMWRQNSVTGPPGISTMLASVGGFERPPVEGGGGGTEGDLPPVEAEHEIPGPRLLHVVGRDHAPSVPRRRALSISRSSNSALAESRPVYGSSSSSSFSVRGKGAGDQRPLALSAGDVSEGLLRSLRQSDHPEAFERPRAVFPSGRVAATRAVAPVLPWPPRRGSVTG